MGGKKWRRSGKEEERVGKRGEVGQAEERETRKRKAAKFIRFVNLDFERFMR